MTKKKTITGQASARVAMDVLKKHYTFTPDTVVGHDVFKNLRLSTSVIVCTIANPMEAGVIMKIDDNRHYFVEKNWNKVVHKVNFVYVILLRLPIIILLAFLGIQMLMSQ